MSKSEYSPQELVDMLKARMGASTLAEASKEIGISVAMLGQILNGQRSVGNKKVLEYLAPPGKAFVYRECYTLVAKK